MKVFNCTEYEKASKWLDDGNLLAYPTEAVWGIGCDPFNEQAVMKLLALKDRAMEKGLIVVTANVPLIQDFLHNLPNHTQQSIVKSWQHSQNQATTWVFPLPKNLATSIPTWVTGGRDDLAIRLINHANIANLCQTLAKSEHNPYGFLVSTSCNPNGLPPAKSLDEAQAYFGDSIGYFNAPTLGYTQPSQIKNAVTGEIVRD